MDKEQYQKIVTQLACANIMLEIETDLRGRGALKYNLKNQVSKTSKMIERHLGETINNLYYTNEDIFATLQVEIEELAKELANKSYNEILKNK